MKNKTREIRKWAFEATFLNLVESFFLILLINQILFKEDFLDPHKSCDFET